MDFGASALHATEPSHLPFGELVDCDFELSKHVVERELADAVESDELIFETIINEVVWRDA